MSRTEYGEKRREIAEGLHWLVADAGPGGVKDKDLFRVLNIGFGDAVEYSDAQDVEHLANLIDWPKTTRDKTKRVYSVERPICERCGYGIGDTRWHYCPNCGAEVVE